MRSTEIPYMTYYMCFDINFGHDKHDTGDTAHSKLNYLDFMLKVIQYHYYDLLYVFHRNLCHSMHHSEDTAH